LKSIFTLLLTFSFVFGFEYNLKPIKVTEDVYCFFGKLDSIKKSNAGNVVNSCFVQTKEGFVVIDSGPTFDYASQAYVQMQKIATLPVKYVINTHDHDDHWLGNSFYKSKGAVLIGTRTIEDNTHPGMETRIGRILGKELFAKTKVVKLDTIVDDNLTLKIGNDTFKIMQPAKIAHTRGDLLVYLPSKKALFVGDLVFNGRLTSLRDGSILGSLKVLDIIESYHADFIIGGHGYDTDKNAAKQFKAYLTEIKTKVRNALDNDIDMDKITKKISMPEYKDMKLYEELHAKNVLGAYQELELIEDDEE
jgi:glyoxylase-like metal-dependent hydrolase (beta-lactamase superfamily II)